jgi:toxin ParE1/3/4
LRGVPIDGYIIFYKYADDDIEIVRVLNGYRDLPSLFAQLDEP